MKEITLDQSAREFEEMLQQAVKLVIDTYQNLEHQKVFNKKDPQEIAALFREKLPEKGAAQSELWRSLKEDVVGNATFSAGPHYYSYVLSPGNQAGVGWRFGQFIS